MFKEVLQIIPSVSASDLSKMERSLGSRFASVAKKFGKGLVATLTGGGIAGAALGLIDKLLNPLQATQDAIDRTLKSADDISTSAKQFNTTAGNLARLQAFGKATGIEPGELNTLLQKFQVAVAQAKADPTAPSAVRNFVGDQDTAKSFFEFIQSLRQIKDTNAQVLVQNEVFGERQIGKMSDFLHSDFVEIAGRIGNAGAGDGGKLTNQIEKLAKLNDRADENAARLGLNDFAPKSQEISQQMIDARTQRDKMALDRENRQIKSYDDLAAISIASDRILNMLIDITLTFTASLVKITEIGNTAKKFESSPIFRGIIKFLKVD